MLLSEVKEEDFLLKDLAALSEVKEEDFLLKDLAALTTFRCGTVRSDRGKFLVEGLRCGNVRSERGKFLVDFKAKMNRGEMKYIKWNEVASVHWRDKRDVYELSTFHGDDKHLVTKKRSTNCREARNYCRVFNKLMNGVDKCDQYLSSYPFSRRTVNWWKNVFVRLFELSVINAMVIYFHEHPDVAKHFF